MNKDRRTTDEQLLTLFYITIWIWFAVQRYFLIVLFKIGQIVWHSALYSELWFYVWILQFLLCCLLRRNHIGLMNSAARKWVFTAKWTKWKSGVSCINLTHKQTVSHACYSGKCNFFFLTTWDTHAYSKTTRNSHSTKSLKVKGLKVTQDNLSNISTWEWRHKVTVCFIVVNAFEADRHY